MIPVLKSICNQRVPGQLVIQITDRCNARCPQCGMRATAAFARADLDTDAIKRTIDAAAQQGVQAVSFTGGEPLLDLDRLIALIHHAAKAGIPFTRTGTNGFMFRHPERPEFLDRVSLLVDRLAATPLRNFWISLDSADDQAHEQMRGFPGVVAGIAKALPVFHRAGIYPAVNLGLNRNVGGDTTFHLPPASGAADLRRFYDRYRAALERFYRRVIDMGFTMANTCYPMSIDGPEGGQGLSAVYAASTADRIVRFTPTEKRMLFTALADVVRHFRSRIRIFSPLSSITALVNQYSGGASMSPYGCRGGIDFFFVTATDGHVYPCGYRGNEDFGVMETIDIRKITPPSQAEACRRCDWECFRDPSELFGPLLEMAAHPRRLIRRLTVHPRMATTWVEDLLYYQACDFFDGRRPPNAKRLGRFAGTGHHPSRSAPATPIHPRTNQKLFDA